MEWSIPRMPLVFELKYSFTALRSSSLLTLHVKIYTEADNYHKLNFYKNLTASLPNKHSDSFRTPTFNSISLNLSYFSLGSINNSSSLNLTYFRHQQTKK